MSAATFFLLLYGFLLGACLGSYLACVWYRVPRGISLLGSSFCPSCTQSIPPHLNLPVIGWVLLRGKSACCGQPIAITYPLIELTGGLVGMLVCVLLPWWLLISSVVLIIIIPVALSLLYRPGAHQPPSCD